LHCEYCNVEEVVGVDFPIYDIDNLIDWLDRSDSNDICSIQWHGGESLLLGYDYFFRIFVSQARYPSRFCNTVSTNGLLLDDKIIHLFAENNVIIKTSLDNLDKAFDKQRNYSCEKVIASLNRLHEQEYKDVYVRTTVSSKNQAFLFDIYKFMCENYNFKWEFAPIVPTGLKKEQAFSLLPDSEPFRNSTINIFNHWFEHYPVEIPFFTEMIKFKLGMSDPPEISQPRLNVGPDGIVYRCPLLIGNHKYEVNHYISNTTIKQLYQFDCVWKKISKVECQECQYKRFCRLASCAYLAVSLEGLDGYKDYFCQLWKPIYDKICATVDRAVYTEEIHNLIKTNR